MSQQALDTLLASNSLHIYVLRDAAQQAIGLAEFDRSGLPSVELKNFGVVPEAQGRGLGRRLLSAALVREFDAGVERIWLHTDSWDHPAALRLYRQAGFQLIAERDEAAGPL